LFYFLLFLEKMKKSLFFIILIFLLIFILQGIYFPSNINNEGKIFLINKGENVFQIARNLDKEELIKNHLFFEFYVLITGRIRNLQAGEYLINSSLNVKEIVQKIVGGNSLKEREITIIEGWDMRDIAWYFENEGMFQAEELMEMAGFPTINYSSVVEVPELKDYSQEFNFLKDKSKSVGLEGYLFPDTYRIYRGDGIDEILSKILGNFDKKLDQDLRDEIKRQNRSIFDIITMASMIEEEVISYEEKELVSGVLWKREKSNIPLQVDSTINYITGKKGFNILKEEKKIDSLFNTYKYIGLPLGPICNPGLESIKASIYPEESNFWYYLSTPEGETLFSGTLEEHNSKKRKYLN